jgi:ribonuclease D
LTTPDAAAPDSPEPDASEPVVPPAPRLQLRDPLPPVTETPEALRDVCDRVRAGSGPIALDAERASGYRYSQRAYLVQLRREGSGTALVDPIAFDDLTPLNEAFGDAEWILHAATQDLMCLAEVGLRPAALFDTELAGRLLNLPRVGLAALVEHYLGLSLAKEFSAADWSTRPLPEPWLVYAALDVEVLIELRNLIDADLQAAGKREWAAEEFEALLSFTGPPERKEPWRRTSGLHRARGRRALALVRELWQTRDGIAADRDVTPGRILPDASLLEIAVAQPADVATLKGMRIMRNRGPRRFLSEWFDAVERGLALDESQLPTSGQQTDGPPPPRAWADKNPAAAERLARTREVVVALAEQHDLPTENLISPQLVRNLAWSPPEPVSIETVSQRLTAEGARGWQVGLVAEPLTAALLPS